MTAAARMLDCPRVQSEVVATRETSGKRTQRPITGLPSDALVQVQAPGADPFTGGLALPAGPHARCPRFRVRQRTGPAANKRPTIPHSTTDSGQADHRRSEEWVPRPCRRGGDRPWGNVAAPQPSGRWLARDSRRERVGEEARCFSAC